MNGSTGLSSSEARRLSRSPSPPLHFEKLRKALVQPLQCFLAVPALINGFTGKSTRSGVHTHPPLGWWPQETAIRGTSGFTAITQELRMVWISKAPPLCVTPRISWLRPTPATQMEGAELGAGRWLPLNLCQKLKLVSEATEIVRFLPLGCPGKYFTGEKENWESGESILPTHPRLPGPCQIIILTESHCGTLDTQGL